MISMYVKWLLSLGYLGAFLGPFIGAFTFYIVPWPILIFALGHLLDPLLVSLLGATGASFGVTLYYLVGVGVRKILPSRLEKYLEAGQSYIKKYGALAIFLFAITPLPDEIVWIPVGIMRYDTRKAFAACWLGKFVLISLIAFSGHYGMKWMLNFLH
jgi:membrane protein YqaA with SNARE-associated domain